jgi:predicted phosphodiesterase
MGLVVAMLAASLTSRSEARIGVGTVEFHVSAGGSGRTELVLPPLGRVTARTHRLPVTLTAEVTSLDVAAVGDLVGADDPGARARDQAAAAVESQARQLALRLVTLSAIVGAATAAIAPGRRWTHLPTGAAGGAVGAVLLLGGVWVGYDVRAFESDPRFEGELERAPALLATVQRHVDDVDVVRSRVGILGARIAELYTAVDEEPASATTGTKILHVSDIHSNPLGIEIVARLVENFDVDAVLDTGDLTSFGSTVETRIGDLIAALDVPYLLVPGNHDAPAVRAAFDALPHVTLLDRTTHRIGAVDVLGVADPTFTADNEVSTDEANEMKLDTAPVVGRLVRRHDPDVLAIHDTRQAETAAGYVPLVVAGHSHTRKVEQRDGTVFLTVGSTGATGLGSFTVDTDLAYEAEVLTFRGDRLVAVDYISLPGFDGSFTVEHTVIRPPDRP